MNTSRKFLMGITGAAFIFLGIICIFQPIATWVAFSWVLGLILLVLGITNLINWFNVRRFLMQSGGVLFSSIIQIILGIIFLRKDPGVLAIVSYVFSFYILIEGINLAFRAFDYKKVGYQGWLVNFIFGLLTAILGLMSLQSPFAGGAAIGILLGAGFVSIGVVYFSALFAVNRFNKLLNKNPWIDEQ